MISKIVKKILSEKTLLKILALVLAIISWYYIDKALNERSKEEIELIRKVLPSEQMAAKKLSIRPIFTGRTRAGFDIVREKVVVFPEYCIVVGSKNMLERLKFIYTLPVDIGQASKSFTKSIPLNPIAPGVYMEETLVQVTVPIERSAK